jgi:serine/threonine protein kinase
LEYCSGGDLHQRAPYTEQDAAKIVKQILSAVKYLHKNRVIHRDLKFENILFESGHPDAEIKLIDFGLSRHFARGKDQRTGYGAGSVYMKIYPKVRYMVSWSHRLHALIWKKTILWRNESGHCTKNIIWRLYI